jgi:hypothetical protein
MYMDLFFPGIGLNPSINVVQHFSDFDGQADAEDVTGLRQVVNDLYGRIVDELVTKS